MHHRLLVGSLVFVSGLLQAYDDYCHTSRRESSMVASVCNGLGPIPLQQTRNFRGQDLVCESDALAHTRRPQPFDFRHWLDLKKVDRRDAYEYRRSLPDPDVEWTGLLPFKTHETWTWDSCDLVTSGLSCGYEEECTSQEEWVDDDEDGKKGTTAKETVRKVRKMVRSCRQLPKTCYVDVAHTQHRFCSTENIRFAAHYELPNEADWNPESPGYADSIPRKIDLLPGEVETVTAVAIRGTSLRVFANSYHRTLHPTVTIDEPRNAYTFDYSGTSLGALCKQHSNYDLHVAIRAIRGRIVSRSPNAFELPKTVEGQPVDPLAWHDGSNPDNSYFPRAFPGQLRLQDTGASAMRVLADDSHRESHITDQARSFDKSTTVRVRLFKKMRYWFRDTEWSRIYVSEEHGVKPCLHAFSLDKQVNLADAWEIELDGSRPSASVYKKDRSWFLQLISRDPYYRQHLEPGSTYELRVSVYQGGVPFYRRSCDDDQTATDCLWWAVWPFARSEESWFSSELTIPFSTPTDYDPRDWWQKGQSFLTFGNTIEWWGWAVVPAMFGMLSVLQHHLKPSLHVKIN